MTVPPRKAGTRSTSRAGARWLFEPDGDSWRVTDTDPSSPRWLRKASGTSWRLIALVAGIALVFYGTSKVVLLFVALFLALVFTAVLRPLVQLLDKVMPRFLATAVALLTGVAVLAGMITYVVYSIANQWQALSTQVGDGVQRIVEWVNTSGGTVQRIGMGDFQDPPFKEAPASPSQALFTVTGDQVAGWLENGKQWLVDHAGTLVGRAADTAGATVEVFTCVALAVFCSVFFLARGSQMWQWCLGQLPRRVRGQVQVAAHVGWHTFSGYTRGTVIIAMIDGVLAGIFLTILHVPLAAPLGVLVFIGAFIPLIGAPMAMIIATIVALAANGPWTALIVLLGIAGIGQIEGHLLQPLIMGKQVALHPVVVAVSVLAGTLTAGILGAVVAVPLVSVVWAVFVRMRPAEPDDEEPQGEEPDDEDVGDPPARVPLPAWGKLNVLVRRVRERKAEERPGEA